MSKLIVLAIGGNSLIKDPRNVSIEDQYASCVSTCKHIAGLIKKGCKVVITHGNGPQVGFMLRRAELAREELHMVPLDSCVADTQGAIGYNIQMALGNTLKKEGIKKNVVTIVSQVLVDRNDSSFSHPSKPIGSFMGKEEAMLHKEKEGWAVAEDAGRGYRRVVPSPKPIEIIEIETIKKLLEQDMVVVAAGGGGIPVIRQKNGFLRGIEAVIDKDLASSLLARELKADLLMISTAVDKVCINFGRPEEEVISKFDVDTAKKYMKEGHFAEGSMLPKIEALVSFVEETGNTGIITSPENLSNAIEEKAGTHLSPSM